MSLYLGGIELSNCNDNCNTVSNTNCNIDTSNCTINTTGNNVLSPILARKIIGCIDYTLSNIDVVDNMVFQLQDLGITYPDGGVVCVDNIVYSYDSIGLTNNPINARLSCCNNVNLFPTNAFTVGEQELYNEYLGETNLSYCGCIDQVKFIEQSLEFYINNLVITVQGTIGGQPFIGTYTYTGTLV